MYPRDLAHSRPDSELLRDFRPSISLPPLPESNSENEEVSKPSESINVRLSMLLSLLVYRRTLLVKSCRRLICLKTAVRWRAWRPPPHQYVAQYLTGYLLMLSSLQVDSIVSFRTDLSETVCKENMAKKTPAVGKLPGKRRYASSSKSTGSKKRPLTVKN